MNKKVKYGIIMGIIIVILLVVVSVVAVNILGRRT